MIKSVKLLADQVLARVAPSVDAHAGCLSCPGYGCVYKCCAVGSRVDWYRCCQEPGYCDCRQVYGC